MFMCLCNIMCRKLDYLVLQKAIQSAERCCRRVERLAD